MDFENDGSASGMSLDEFLRLLRRRRDIIIQTFIVIAVVGTAISLLRHNVYEASAQLLVEAPSMNVNTVDTSNPLSSILTTSPPQTVSTQVEQLQSRSVMDSVRGMVGPADISVAEVKDTNIIAVTARATDPQVAARACNTLLETYIDQDANQNLNELKSAETFCNEQGDAANVKLLELERELSDFKRIHHLGELFQERDLQIERVGRLTDDAHADLTELESVKSQIQVTEALVAAQPPYVSYAMPTNNLEIAKIQDELSSLETQKAGLVQKGGYTEKAPIVVGLNGQIASLQSQLAAQPAVGKSIYSAPNETWTSLREKLSDLQSEEAALTAELKQTDLILADAQAQVSKFAVWEMTLANLSRQHDAALDAVNMFTEKLVDITLRERANHVSAQIIERAQPSYSPVKPTRLQSILFSCIMGLFAGVCLALLQDFLDDRINSIEEGGRVLDLPFLGNVPELSAEDAGLLPRMKGVNPAAEAYRLLRTNINFTSIDAPLRTLLVTSCDPGDGKTTTATNLAFAMAFDGKKVILVDTDLRRPSLHKMLSLSPKGSLTDLLLGKCTMEQALVVNQDIPNLSVLTAGPSAPNPNELLNSRTFKTVVKNLVDASDIVIFDSPPVMAVSDSLILASQFDGTILVIEAGGTKKKSARRVVQLLRQARARVLGIAYNKIQAHDGTGYYYYNYHYTTPEADEKASNAGAKLSGGEDKK